MEAGALPTGPARVAAAGMAAATAEPEAAMRRRVRTAIPANRTAGPVGGPAAREAARPGLGA